MKLRVAVPFAAAGVLLIAGMWAQAASLSREATGTDHFVVNAANRTFTVDGTLVSTRGGKIVVRIDDHHHLIPFSLDSSVSTSDLRVGSRVAVRYHPTGSTGQEAESVEVLAGPRGARSR